MAGRGGRDRFRRDYPPRSEEKSHSGRGSAPPSRHLWVGNLSHSINEDTLCGHFLRFGELDSVAFQPGRSYAFINFQREEDAIAAMRGLQGFLVAGMPLRIQFAKAEKSEQPLRDENFSQRRDEQRSAVKGSQFLQRDSGTHRTSPEKLYSDNPKMGDKNAEPSEVLWIGFPALLKVDEMALRKAFSPFGEIEKVTVFPGRSYAFVQFRSVMAACRAKGALQGKLFGNPRVHICFSRSERGISNSGRHSMDVSPSPHYKPLSHSGPSDNYWEDREFGGFSGDFGLRSPPFNSNLESRDSDVRTISMNDNLWTGGNSTFGKRRFGGELSSELRLSEDIYDHSHSTTGDEGAHFRDFPLQKFPQKPPLYDDPWDLPEDAFLLHGAKRLRTESFPPEKELPDYPFPDSEKDKHMFPRMFSDLQRPEALDQKVESVSIGYKQAPDHWINLNGAHSDRSSHHTASLNGYQIASGSLPSNLVDGKILAPESGQSSLNGEWKWEGVIAKGGTPICRARCFPVGKALDVILPELLDCTARTGLDMLAKHYYQAAGAWVVFFVPESDADIGFYNEFMHYLEEKQRAAVAKLDDKTTLFLVPPSDFSQNVLKVPGKLSISGVVLRLEHSGPSLGSLHHLHESFDTSHPKLMSPSATFSQSTSYPSFSKLGANNISHPANMSIPDPPASYSGSSYAQSMSNTNSEDRQGYPFQHMNSTLGPNKSSPHLVQNSILGPRNMLPQASPKNASTHVTGQDFHSAVSQQETSSNHYTAGSGKPPSLQETKTPISLTMPVATLQSEQLSKLASTLLGQQRQLGGSSSVFPSGMESTSNQSEKPFGAPQMFSSYENDQVSSKQQIEPQQQWQQHQGQQQWQQQVQPQQQQQIPPQWQQQTLNVPQNGQRAVQEATVANQQLQTTGTHEDGEADPQKRLQATLQLAAALLQQIQQGKPT